MSSNRSNWFGPPSDIINIAQFIQSAVAYEPHRTVFAPGVGTVHASDQRKLVAMECDVSDIRTSLVDTWNDPDTAAYLANNHAVTLAGIHDSADTSSKRRRKRPRYSEPSEQSGKVVALQKELDAIQLTSWPFTLHSALFLRMPKNADHNSLTKVVSQSDAHPSSPNSQNAYITVSVYSPITWDHGNLSRLSQHAILSFQSLADLTDVIPCRSHIPGAEIIEEGRVVGYNTSTTLQDGCLGGVLCIEGVTYSNRESDYAEKLLSFIDTMPVEKRASIKKATTTTHETLLSTLSLRLNEPYWFLHQGNCEHFIVFDQIRLQHPADPKSGYPLTLHLAPTLTDLCRACTKVPAVWSVVGDIRLGESPCLLCGVCRRSMGEADSDDDDAVAVPLPKPRLTQRH